MNAPTDDYDVVCYYYDSVKAPLLREAVFPALRAIPDAVAVHLERGWLHGPHVRVRLTGPEAEAAAQEVADRLSRYLREHPSAADRTPAELLRASIALGRAELVPPPYEPFEPDNSVRIESGPGRALDVRTAVLRAGLPAVEATVHELGHHLDRPGARVQAAVVALTVFAGSGPWQLKGNYLSYLSHLEAYLHQYDTDGRLRAAQTEVWRQRQHQVTALVADRTDSSADDEFAGAWRRWSGEVRALAAQAFDQGRLTSASVSREEMARRLEQIDPGASRRQGASGMSEFHRLIGTIERDDAERRLFEIERYSVNLLYLLLAVTDIRPDERYLAGSLVYRAAERLSGRTWREVFGVSPEPTIPAASAVRVRP